MRLIKGKDLAHKIGKDEVYIHSFKDDEIAIMSCDKYRKLLHFAPAKTKDFLKSKLNEFYSDNGFIPSEEGLIFLNL